MCLAVPAKVVTMEMGEAMVDMHGNAVRVSTILVPSIHWMRATAMASSAVVGFSERCPSAMSTMCALGSH